MGLKLLLERDGCGFDPHSRERIIINVFISSLWHQGKKAAVEFRHSTRNVSKKWGESGERSMLTICSLCLSCCVRDTA